MILWKDCNNDCTFCSQKDTRDNLTHEQRKNRLIKTVEWIHNTDLSDRFGLIGGELFCFDNLDEEWKQVALAVNESRIERLFLTSNLIGNTHNLVNFLSYVNKPVTVCTSYDTTGRFNNDYAIQEWRENVARIQKMAEICCTSIMTKEFLQDDVHLMDNIYFNLQEPIISPEWYYNDTSKNRTYCESLRNAAPVHLMNRGDFLRWAVKHRDYIEHYHDYASTHSDELYEFIDEKIVMKYHERMSMNIAPCGHQYSARCYADSDKCVQCDVQMLLE